MAVNIVHESDGATSKNLAVTGIPVAIPYESDLHSNWQIDFGVSANEDDELQYWDDKQFSNRLTRQGSIYPVMLDRDNQLIGLPSVKMWKKSGTLKHTLRSSAYWTNANPYTAAQRIYTIALLYKRTLGMEGDTVLSPQPGDSYTTGTLGWLLNIYLNGNVEINVSAFGDVYDWTPRGALWEAAATTTSWNTYVFRVDFPAKTIDMWINGVPKTQKTFTRMDFPPHTSGFPNGALGHYNNSGWHSTNSGNFAALLVWNYGVTFDADDYAMADLYLRTKYGLA